MAIPVLDGRSENVVHIKISTCEDRCRNTEGECLTDVQVAVPSGGVVYIVYLEIHVSEASTPSPQLTVHEICLLGK